jgi:hypothetical protein
MKAKQPSAPSECDIVLMSYGWTCVDTKDAIASVLSRRENAGRRGTLRAMVRRFGASLAHVTRHRPTRAPSDVAAGKG